MVYFCVLMNWYISWMWGMNSTQFDLVLVGASSSLPIFSCLPWLDKGQRCWAWFQIWAFCPSSFSTHDASLSWFHYFCLGSWSEINVCYCLWMETPLCSVAHIYPSSEVLAAEQVLSIWCIKMEGVSGIKLACISLGSLKEIYTLIYTPHMYVYITIYMVYIHSICSVL